MAESDSVDLEGFDAQTRQALPLDDMKVTR